MKHLTFNPMSARKPATRGFTLVEVLVAVLVISIGMLGVAKLVLAAVKANDSAYFRSQAAALAYSILDDMRANHQYAVSSLGYIVKYGAAATPPVMCDTAVCTPSETAQYDIYEWKRHLNAATGGELPSGDGKIDMVPNSGQVTATITIQWDDSVAQWAFGTPKDVTPTLTTFTLESAL